MKELSIKEKAKAYDEAIRKAKITLGCCDSASIITEHTIYDIFPELKESEDEMIRKGLIKGLSAMRDIHHHQTFSDDAINIDDAIAWLEKQGKQKPVWHNEGEEPQKDSLILLIMQSGIPVVAKIIEPHHTFTHGERWAYIDDLLEKPSEQKPVDKVEPKFHEGEWIVHHGTENIYQVVAVIDNQYQLKYGNNYTVQKCADVDRCARLWDISKDAKDGDVLVYKDEISLYKHDINNCTNQETTFGGFVFHCCYDGKRFIMDSLYSLTEQDKMDIQPATKEQRDLLFSKMKKAGYEWDVIRKNCQNV